MADIGLKAVMEMAGFTAGINKYNDMVGGASSNTEKHAGIMSRALAGIGTAAKMAAGVAVGGVAALAAAFTGAVVATTSWAEKLDSVGDVLGTTAAESAALAVAAQHIGGNVEQLSSQMAILTRGLFDAKGEIGPTGKVLKDMGVAFQDANGKMLPTTDILQAVADKIGNMPDSLEKTQLMMDLFGKSGKDMSDMLGVLAGGGMAKFDKQAKAMGLSMSEDGVSGAIKFNRSINDLKMMFQGFLVQVGTKALPFFQTLIETLSIIGQNVIPIVVNALKPLTEFLGKAASAVDELINELLGGQEPLFAITQFIARIFGLDAAAHFHWIAQSVLEFASQARDFLVPVLQTISDFIQTKVVPALQQIGGFIIDTVIPAIGNLITWFRDNLPIAMAAVSDFWNNTLYPTIQDIVAWLGEKIPEAVQTLTDFWNNKLLPAMKDFAAWVQANWQPLVAALVAIILNIVVPAFVAWAGAAISAAIATITALAPVIAIAAAVGAAVFLLYKAWDTNFLGIRTTVTEFWNNHLKPAFEDIKEWLEVAIPKATEWLKIAFGNVKDFIVKDLYPVLEDIAEWLGPIIKTVIETFVNTIWPKIKTALADVWGFITTYIIGPDGVFTKIYNWLKTAIGDAVEIAKGVLDELKIAWEAISTAVSTVVGWIEKVINELNKIKIPDWLKPGSPPPLALALFDIAKGFMMAAAAADVFDKATSNLKPLKSNMAGGLTGFAGAIMGRFQEKVLSPLEEQQQAILARLEMYKALQANATTPEEYNQLNIQIARAQKEYTEITIQLNKEKERELALQKQLNDLAFLQAQMDFISFLAQNNLDISDILGNLQLGLGLDLAAFMDAITRALATLVAQLNIQLGPPGDAPGTPEPRPFAGPGFAGSSGMAVYNNQAVTINMNVALNNGMDIESFKVLVRDTVMGDLR